MKTRSDAVGARFLKTRLTDCRDHPIPPEWMPDPDDRAAVAREQERVETVDSLLPRTVASKALREAAAATPHGWCYASRDWRGRYDLVAPGDVDTRRQTGRIYRVRVHPDRVPQWTDTDRRLELARRARLARTRTVEQAGVHPGEQREGAIGGVEFATPAQAAAARAACIGRWEFVKALVLGQKGGCAAMPAAEQAGVGPLVKQRDTVFAGLAEMVRYERGAMSAQHKVESAFPYHRFHYVGGGDHHANPPSHARLAAYVDFLVEEVGKLP